MYDLAVVGGKVHTSKGWRRLDVAVRGERIAAVTRLSRRRRRLCRQLLDASGCLVIPGAIDPHVHLSLTIGPGMTTADDFATGTRAAAAAGITTVIDYTTPQPGQTPLSAFRARRRLADSLVACDYSLHNVLIEFRSSWHKQLARLVELGAPSVKLFMIYAERGWRSDDARLFEIMKLARRLGLITCVHAENHELINLFTARADKHSAAALAESRPPLVELEAVQRAILLAEHSGARLHLVHLSCADSAAAVAAARRRGVAVSGETCPQYLALNSSRLRGRDGHLWGCCPPLRPRGEPAHLLRALAQGQLQALATDHCAFTRRQKDSWGGDFRRIPYGLAGLETALAVTHTRGPAAGLMPTSRWARLHSEAPARLFGLWPRKGRLAPGADADILVWDPQVRWRVRPDKLETAIDWNPYQGRLLRGRARLVVSRGLMVAREGRFCGPEGRGRFVKRQPYR